MTIERTTSEFIIRFPFTSDIERMQDMVDYLRYKELTAKYELAQSEVDNLAKSINKQWWQKNQYKFD
ncbi:MAG: hypothetical protein LBE56_06705 [Tannerella sp.]|nr:hypothetical protein [Tannerella sp.]